MIKHLSYSSINLYTMCARAWRYRYLDKVKTPRSFNLVFGSAFHNAVEAAIANSDVSAPLVTYWDGAWKDQLERGEVDWQDKTEQEIYDLGVKMLSAKAIVEQIEALGRVCAIEEKVILRVPGVPVPIIAYIDVIGADGVPCDFKTAARSWNQKKADTELQPSFYLAALNQRDWEGWKQNPELKFRYYVFVKTKTPKVQELVTRRTPAQLLQLLGFIRDVWQSIEAGIESDNFPQTGQGSWKCSEKYCEFWPMCMGGS